METLLDWWAVALCGLVFLFPVVIFTVYIMRANSIAREMDKRQKEYER